MMYILTILFFFSRYLNTKLFLKKNVVLYLHKDFDFSLTLQGFDTRFEDDLNNTLHIDQLKFNWHKKQLLDYLTNRNIALESKLTKISETQWLFLNNHLVSLIENSDFDFEDFQC